VTPRPVLVENTSQKVPIEEAKEPREPVRATMTRTEFGDLPLFDVVVLPWPDRQKTGLLIAVGPTFVFPTATSKSAGKALGRLGPLSGRSTPVSRDFS
jgi:hypothetical protein